MFTRLFSARSPLTPLPEGQILYAIGDVHGCAALMDMLIEQINADYERLRADNAALNAAPTLIFLGDYVDRGPDSAGVIERLVKLKNSDTHMITLKGNHEAAMLDFLANPEDMDHWLEWGGLETLTSYGVDTSLGQAPTTMASALHAAMPSAHLDFLKNLPLYHTVGDYVFCPCRAASRRGARRTR